MMANRLKPYLGDLMFVNISAFIPKRLITDNALIAFETFHSMKRRTNGRNNTFALKLDMSKAYDRIEWGFLERVKLKLGFSMSWVNRIMRCVSSVSFSFKINGKICGNVIPSRGLRQRDLISPYLFILCAKAFSSLISRAVQQKAIHGVRICNGAPIISHLFFADDSILFAKASLDECSVVASIISRYERASGQRVNYKSVISFSKGVSASIRQDIITHLGVKGMDKHSKYLGLPTIIGRSKKDIFLILKDRVSKKLQGWKEKFLSRPGKEVLLKAVIQAIPTYMMSIFRLLNSLISDIHSMMARFCWGSSGDNRCMHWHSWSNMCYPKVKGGMGF